ncbi:hypothetical protein LCGC14_0387160 [marine sediment metagenome]|uniref:Uncharacterized protein n=1 Tax=marine sediment metagenome TaxID=412755 RepID=A0A0F9W9Q8_9ZZZZ
MKYTPGQIVMVTGRIRRHYDDDHRTWERENFDESCEVMVLGYTTKLVGTVTANEFELVPAYNTNDVKEQFCGGGIDVENTVPALMVMPVAKYRYRVPFPVHVDQVQEEA